MDTSSSLEVNPITIVVESFMTWLVVGIYRKFFPSQWNSIDSSKLKMMIVAFSSVLVSVIYGLFGGLGWTQILHNSVAAFAGAVTLRNATKPTEYTPSIGREVSINTSISPKG